MSKMLTSICAAVLGVFSMVAWSSETKQQSGEELQHFASLPKDTGLERRDYISQLEKSDKRDAIHEIAMSKAEWATFAISAYARLLPDEKVLDFVKSFDIGSEDWVAAAGVLDLHEKKTVIEYLRKAAASSNVEARYVCYSLCRKANWADLLEMANKDIGNNTGVSLPNVPFFESTIGALAKSYIEKIEFNKLKSNENKR